MRSHPRTKRGFTLTEMMIAAAITVVTISLTMSSFMTLTKAATSSASYTHLHGELRHAMDMIERDLRAGVNVIWAPGPSNGIGLEIKTAAGNERVYYYRQDTTLYCWKNDRSREIATGLSGVTFSILDADGKPTTIMANASAVDITLNGSTTVLSKNCTDTLRTRIVMRN